MSFSKKLKTATELLKHGKFGEFNYRVKNSILYGFTPLIDVKELSRVQRKALNFLETKISDKNELGDYLEFGVCNGSSLLSMHNSMSKLGFESARLIGFDSFEGLPDEASNQGNGVWKPGDFAAKIENVKRYLSKNGINWGNTTLIKGWFKDTLKPELKEELQLKKASIIMIDCDIYTATKEALDFCESLIKDFAIIIFDDWNSSNLASKNLGEKKAFEEFIKEHNNIFSVEDFDSYSYRNNLNGEVKLITRNK